MEPKSIAFYTAVAISLLAVSSATIFPTLVQVVQATTATTAPADDTAQAEGTQQAADDDTAQAEGTQQAAAEDEPNSSESNDATNNEASSDDGAGSQDQGLALAESPEAISCGTVIRESGDYSLPRSLNCLGRDGIIIVAEGVTLDLNGNTISSEADNSGSEENLMNFAGNSGIVVSNVDDVTIRGEGTITGFDTAIEIIGSSAAVVSGLTIEGNSLGVLLSNAEATEASRNTFSNNDAALVSYTSNGGVMMLNQVMDNEQGFVFENSDGNVVAANNILGNPGNGVYFDQRSNENEVDYNIAVENGVDLNNANGLPPDVNANNFGMHNICNVSEPPGLC